MRIHRGAFFYSGVLSALLIGFVTVPVPALADSVAVASGPNGMVIVNGKPCRVVIGHGQRDPNGLNGTSTTVTVGPNHLSGSTTVSPGGNGSSVTVGSGSASNGTQSSSVAGADCVIYRDGSDK